MCPDSGSDSLEKLFCFLRVTLQEELYPMVECHLCNQSLPGQSVGLKVYMGTELVLHRVQV